MLNTFSIIVIYLSQQKQPFAVRNCTKLDQTVCQLQFKASYYFSFS